MNNFSTITYVIENEPKYFFFFLEYIRRKDYMVLAAIFTYEYFSFEVKNRLAKNERKFKPRLHTNNEG